MFGIRPTNAAGTMGIRRAREREGAGDCMILRILSLTIHVETRELLGRKYLHVVHLSAFEALRPVHYPRDELVHRASIRSHVAGLLEDSENHCPAEQQRRKPMLPSPYDGGSG